MTMMMNTKLMMRTATCRNPFFFFIKKNVKNKEPNNKQTFVWSKKARFKVTLQNTNITKGFIYPSAV